MRFDEIAERIHAYRPADALEAADKETMQRVLDAFGAQTLFRHCPAHLTGSGFIVNPDRTKALFVHHLLRNAWSWTGGHADGEADLFSVALREAREETGAPGFASASGDIASLDVFAVEGHRKRGRYVSAHLHLSLAYILVLDEAAPIRPLMQENTAVRWVDFADFGSGMFGPEDTVLYTKLMQRAQRP